MKLFFDLLLILFGFLGGIVLLNLFPLLWWDVFPVRIFKKVITVQDYSNQTPKLFFGFILVGNLLMFVFQRFIH